MDIEVTGGGRIGSAHASWPFATLKVNKNILELNISIVGTLVFTSKDIISIVSYSRPMGGKGIKINHKVESYDSDVVFWSTMDTDTLISQIKQTCFFENKFNIDDDHYQEIADLQKSGSFPIKRSFKIGFGIAWNVLLLSDVAFFITSDKKGIPLGLGTSVALIGVFITSILLLVSENFRRLILKKGRSINSINKMLFLAMFVCIFMLTIISLLSNVIWQP